MKKLIIILLLFIFLTGCFYEPYLKEGRFTDWKKIFIISREGVVKAYQIKIEKGFSYNWLTVKDEEFIALSYGSWVKSIK